MNVLSGIGRTAYVGELKTIKNSKKKDFTTIWFKLAVRRKYKSNGNYKTDFHLCNANGKTAELIEKYLNKKKENGKILSKYIYFIGNLETFKAKNKQIITLDSGEELEVISEYDQSVIKIENFQILDKKNNNEAEVRTEKKYDFTDDESDDLDFGLNDKIENEKTEEKLNFNKSINEIDEEIEEFNDISKEFDTIQNY